MKNLLALALLAAAGCHAPKDWDPEEARELVPPLEPVVVEYDVRIPDGPPLQYMAMQVDDNRALSPWLDSRSEAESAGREWSSKARGLDWYVIWRQKPQPDGRP